MKSKYLTEDKEWVRCRKGFNSSMYVEKAGYFDERPQIHTSVTQLLVLFLLPFLLYISIWFLLLIPFIFFGYGKLYINLPIHTGIQDCVSAGYGFNYHGNKIWIYIGGGGNFEGGKKWKTITMPWEPTWVRTSTLMKNGYDWFSETKSNRVKWEENENVLGSYTWLQKNKWKETYPFIDKYDNTIVNATISVKEYEWRPKWLMWTNLSSKVKRTIDIDFDNEVGKEKGSYKGGVNRCAYDLLPNETPLQCLKRMELNRIF